MKPINRKRMTMFIHLAVVASALGAVFVAAQTRPPSLLILEKRDRALAIVDPTSLQILARVPTGEDPHEVVASPDGKFAYASDYGGPQSLLNMISVIDLVARKPAPPIDLGALHGAHGLAFAGGKLYFTAETNKVIARYDPASQRIDWILGTGQDRTHMIGVAPDLEHIFTSNVNSDSISIIEQTLDPSPFGPPPGQGGPGNAGPPPGPPPGGPQKVWHQSIMHIGKGPEGFDVTPGGQQIWAANSHDSSVSIIDVATKKVVATLSVPFKMANRLKFTPDGTKVLISDLGGPLVVMDVASRKEIKRIDVGRGAAGILMEPGGRRAFVAVSPDNKVVVVDLATLQITGTIATGNEPDGLAWVSR
ncbi:MAG: YncE family protein [Candidatus Acidiferrales bacterium]